MNIEQKAKASDVFPELKESEDEIVIAALKSGINGLLKKEYHLKGIGGISFDRINAWLEKQSEKKSNPVLDIEIPFGAKDSELQEASYYIPEGFHAEIEGNRVVIKRGEQKPAWSEEDELHIRELESLVKQVWATAEHKNDKDAIHKMSELSFFLKTLKPQLKQEWSEEDEDTIKFLISHFCISHCNRSFQFTSNKLITHDELLEKIRNLKPQNTWKPSDEQMEAIESAVKSYPHVGTRKQVVLLELLEQLKAL